MSYRLLLVAFAACYRPAPSPGSPCSQTQPCPTELVCSPATHSCERSGVNADAATDGPPPHDALPDGFVAVVGAGTVGSPFVAVADSPPSCSAFLISYPSQAGHDGVYRLDLGTLGTKFDVYCDMTTDGGGWTLAARVMSASTVHVTASALGMLTVPTQITTAKLSDATINSLSFTHARLTIETLGTVYAQVTALDLSGTQFNTPNAAAAALAGPYTFNFLTQTGCSSDCGVAVARPDIGFGNNCGYQYYAAAGNPKPGMGCQANFAHSGTVWVK